MLVDRFLVEEPNEEGQYEENWCDTGDSRYPSGLGTVSGGEVVLRKFLYFLLALRNRGAPAKVL